MGNILNRAISAGDALEIIQVQSRHEGALCNLFQSISKSSESIYFHPHLFSDEVASDIANYEGKDLYYLVMLAGRALGYGMLRGWDEGFDEPSLGIYVAPGARGKGISQLLMAHMHLAARFKGANFVRLKVYQKNIKAKNLYARLGYVFDQELSINGQLLGRRKLD